jgi:hypothetical protein
MKTFLQLCQAVCREAAVANGESAITTTVGQIGQLGRIVEYVRQAWLEIQTRHQHSGLHWRWMRSNFEITTVADQDSYAFNDAAVQDVRGTAEDITRFRNWMIQDWEDPPRIYLQSAGVGTQTFMTYMPWNDFKYLYRIGTQNPSQPIHVSISPDNKLVVGPKPSGIYVINGDYMKGVQRFTANDDTPDLPEDFEDAIVFLALIKYGLQKNAAEAITMGEDSYATYIGALEGDQLSEIYVGGPLA